MNISSENLLNCLHNSNISDKEREAIMDGIYAIENRYDKIKDKRSSILTLSKLYLPEFSGEQKQAITDAIYALNK